MADMFGVFNRMTVWTKNFQVLHAVIRPIAVFVMNAKNLCVLIKTASLARIQQTSPFHIFSDSAEITFPIFNCRFVDTSTRTIFSFFRWSRKKSCFAMKAGVLKSSFIFHCCVIAIWATVFCFVCPACNVLKNRIANFTSCFLNGSSRQCHTTSSAEQSSVFSVFRNKKLFAAMLAKFFVFHSGACYATHK